MRVEEWNFSSHFHELSHPFPPGPDFAKALLQSSPSKLRSMEQLNIFDNASNNFGLPADLVTYRPGFIGAAESMQLLRDFIKGVAWRQQTVHMYGKEINTPRLTAWYGDPNTAYTFSGTKLNPLPWTTALRTLKNEIEAATGFTYNSVLLNFYRDGNDSVAWHSDDENELGLRPVIASVSLGQPRKFDFRHKEDHTRKYSLELGNGSLLLMQGDLQHHWEHRIPKSTLPMKERINLTFRTIHHGVDFNAGLSYNFPGKVL